MDLAVFGGLAVVFAVLALFQRTLYGSAICLLVVLLQVAGIFFVTGAQLLALMQVLVYAGAIMVLIVVAIMAAPPKLDRLWAGYQAPPLAAALVLVVLGIEFYLILIHGQRPLPPAAEMSSAGLEREMAALLFGRYALATELVGVLVLVAALAVVPAAVERRAAPSRPRRAAPRENLPAEPAEA